MENLKFVDFEGTATENLPLSMQNLQGLQRLHLNRCKRLEHIAQTNILQMLPNSFPFLKTLRLRNSNLTILHCLHWWNKAEVLFVIPPDSGCSGTIKWTGVYVNQKFTRMEDV